MSESDPTRTFDQPSVVLQVSLWRQLIQRDDAAVTFFSLLRGSGPMTQPEPVIAASEEIRFPRLYFAIKWTIIASLIFMALADRLPGCRDCLIETTKTDECSAHSCKR